MVSHPQKLKRSNSRQSSNRLRSNDNPKPTVENRGLFVLGLIAVLATVRFGLGVNAAIEVGRISLNVAWLFDALLVFWGAYAFLMTLSQTNDFIIFWADTFLKAGLALILLFVTLVFILGFSPTSYYVIVLVAAYLILHSREHVPRLWKSFLKAMKQLSGTKLTRRQEISRGVFFMCLGSLILITTSGIDSQFVQYALLTILILGLVAVVYPVLKKSG
jgi:hypothetical protein